jgi:hypothetical protein
MEDDRFVENGWGYSEEEEDDDDDMDVDFDDGVDDATVLTAPPNVAAAAKAANNNFAGLDDAEDDYDDDEEEDSIHLDRAMILDPPDYIDPRQQDIWLPDMTSNLLHNTISGLFEGLYLSPSAQVQTTPLAGYIYGLNNRLVLNVITNARRFRDSTSDDVVEYSEIQHYLCLRYCFSPHVHMRRGHESVAWYEECERW